MKNLCNETWLSCRGVVFSPHYLFFKITNPLFAPPATLSNKNFLEENDKPVDNLFKPNFASFSIDFLILKHH